ncbi:MAG: group II intron reverse transcriptase/maturase [Planctomycetota bacterium]
MAHHIDVNLLRAAFLRLRKNAASGVDGQSTAEFAADLEANLDRLHNQLKSGLYRAPPVRRVYIPKDGGKRRPIGIPTVADKVLQGAVAMVLGAIYEQDFLDCSYGFRPRRSAHQALERLRGELMAVKGGYVIELDIESFFDTLLHAALRSFLDKRVRDGVIRRAIGKWLKAGVLENGVHRHGEEGTPQGGLISPLLANIYLHEVLDVWFETVVKPRMYGRAAMVRYADDAVLVFQREDDARRVLAVLPKRFAKFGLKLHPEKTRLVPFQRPPRSGPLGKGPGSFDFLGFTHYWARSRKGNNVIGQKTAKKRLQRALSRITAWCRRHRHLPIREQRKELNQKLRGHYGYYGVTNNYRALSQFAREVARIWRKWLGRRSWHSGMPWPRFTLLLESYPLERPRITHQYSHAASL